MPTVEQIATIAATLARNVGDKPEALADAAMNLWLASRERIFFSDCSHEVWKQDVELFSNAYVIQYTRENPFFLEYIEPLPIYRDDFLRAVLPQFKNRTADLARIAKAYVRDALCQRAGKEPSQIEISEAYGKWKPLENTNQANAMAVCFVQWYRNHIKASRRAAGKISAAEKKLKK